MVDRLARAYIKFPQGEELKRTMGDWHGQGLTGCAGAIDGCLLPVQNPDPVNGHVYFCYKKFYAILLLAICDADGYFTFIDVGQPGRTPCHTRPSSRQVVSLLYDNLLPQLADRYITSNGATS